GCVVTVEETPNPPRRLETTFCPKVGLTRMVVEGDGDDGVLSLTTELLGYGPREDLSSPQNP
ncbi:MAG TPA: hypothetical protein VLC09_15385, partial [Polyangiaceae bacterium]|nr:hypothetical protein [Polyangiaceae bacterium]